MKKWKTRVDLDFLEEWYLYLWIFFVQNYNFVYMEIYTYLFTNFSKKYLHTRALKKNQYTTMHPVKQRMGRHKMTFTIIYTSKLNGMMQITMTTYALILLTSEIWVIIAIFVMSRKEGVTTWKFDYPYHVIYKEDSFVLVRNIRLVNYCIHDNADTGLRRLVFWKVYIFIWIRKH